MAEMSREQLEQFTLKIRQELEREREERNFFQLERDKLRTFWEITRQQLEEFRAMLRNKDRAIEVAEEEHQKEVKEFKQKIKHLMYEHTTRLTELQAENMVMLRSEQDQHNEEEIELLEDKRALKRTLREMKETQDEAIRALELEHSSKLRSLREKYESESVNMEAAYKKRLEELRECLTAAHDTSSSELEEQKNLQIHQLIANHEKALEEIKLYYNDITLNNLGIISTLKDQMVEMKKKEERMEKQMVELKQANKSLVEPLREADKELKELRKKVNNYQQERQMLNITKKQLAAARNEVNDLKAHYLSLEVQFEKVKKERDEYHDNFVAVILELQQKSDLRNNILQKKMEAMTAAIEKREAQLAESAGTAKIDPSFSKVEVRTRDSQISYMVATEFGKLNSPRHILVKYPDNYTNARFLKRHSLKFEIVFGQNLSFETSNSLEKENKGDLTIFP
ncbi:dynein regulatory complex subunit 4 isoform X1 [Bemisia tabaci]|uniref:dynein regulatory complex subunit 4 isoform X1 n=1 Tax=Bemisia tabaci TaxID=7038 RepID=UPI003B280879